jgi:hypothetical protein
MEPERNPEGQQFKTGQRVKVDGRYVDQHGHVSYHSARCLIHLQ